MTADRIHGSAPQSSFKRPRITNLLHLLAAELEFLDRRQVRCEPGGTIGPELGAIRRRTFIATRAEGHPADHSALYFGHEQLRHAVGDGPAPHCLALVDRQGRQVLSGHDALVGGLPGGDVDFRDLARILKPGGSDVHGGCLASTCCARSPADCDGARGFPSASTCRARSTPRPPAYPVEARPKAASSR